jgi:hypothetical protein
MGRRDRDWATSADGFSVLSPTWRRARDIALLAVVGTGLATWGFLHFTHLKPHLPSLRSAVVYGSGHTTLPGDSRPATCTAIANQVCTAWTVVLLGQRAVRAQPLPPGTPCSSAKVDQHAGRWVCADSP